MARAVSEEPQGDEGSRSERRACLRPEEAEQAEAAEHLPTAKLQDEDNQCAVSVHHPVGGTAAGIDLFIPNTLCPTRGLLCDGQQEPGKLLLHVRYRGNIHWHER